MGEGAFGLVDRKLALKYCGQTSQVDLSASLLGSNIFTTYQMKELSQERLYPHILQTASM